jgi:hypothetical protein
MPDAPGPIRKDQPDEPESRTDRSSSPRSDEEQRVWDALEKARQNVKQLTKRELEAEQLPSELMSFRLKFAR